MPGGILPGAKTPHFAPGNPFFPPPGAKQGKIAPGGRRCLTRADNLGCIIGKSAPQRLLNHAAGCKMGPNCTPIRFAAAGGEDVRGPAPVCPCCRGVCASRAVGAAAAGAEGRKACGVQSDKHFLLGWLQPHRLCRKHRVQVACWFSSRLLAVWEEIPDQVGHDKDPGRKDLLFRK